MGRAAVVIRSDADRKRAATWATKAPYGCVVDFKQSKRSIPQNSLLWSLLSEVATQVVWYGQKLTATDWKDMFTASLRKARVVSGIDPGSFVLLGLHTSDMTKDELSNLIELIHAFGAEHGVVFQDQVSQRAENPAVERPASAQRLGVKRDAGHGLEVA